MKSDKIINIGIFAHVDAGKTTITEQMLYICGKIRKIGSVDSGTAQTDWLSVERERGISVRAADTNVEYKGFNINIVDTPGHVDFAGEVERVFSALDGAVLAVSAVEGIQSHTVSLWHSLENQSIPCIIFVNKTDRAGSDVAKIKRDFSKHLGANLVESFDIGTLTEILSDYYDDIAELYLGGKAVPQQLILTHFREAVRTRKLIPILEGAAKFGKGICELLDAVIEYLPTASENPRQALSGSDKADVFVFKIEHDKDMGKVAHVRMFGGTLRSRDVYNGEKITQIRKFNGSKFVDVGEIGEGDIAALCGLETIAYDKFSHHDNYRLAVPFLTVRVTPNNDSELAPLITAMKELTEEDPLINYKWEKSEREININLTGKIQLEIIDSILQERYNLKANFSPPSVIYKETPTHEGIGFEAYTMPKPCWAVVQFKIEPLPRGSGVVYDEGNVPNNQLFYRYQTHIKNSFFTSIEQGIHGWEVTDMKVTLTGGEHHTIHTHPLDFFVATPVAFLNGLTDCGSTLLEPLIKIRVTAPENYLGRFISDVTQMRGEFDTPVIDKETFTDEAIVPVATSLNYPVRLAAFTGGKASFSSIFYGYRDCPLELGATAKYRGVCPLDRAKWILYARGAIQGSLPTN